MGLKFSRMRLDGKGATNEAWRTYRHDVLAIAALLFANVSLAFAYLEQLAGLSSASIGTRDVTKSYIT